MKLELLPSCVPGSLELQYASSYLVDGRLAIDAGSIGWNGSPQDQAKIEGLVLTHCHMDHVSSLPVWILNVRDEGRDTVVVHASEHTIDVLCRDLFGGRIWADFTRLEDDQGRPFLRFEAIEPESPIDLLGYRVTSCPVDHTVPTIGVLVDDGNDAVIFGADSGPTNRIWQLAEDCERLRAVVLELSLPDRLSDVARIAKHHTPSTFAAELRKLPAGVRVWATHLKASYQDELRAFLDELDDDRVEWLAPGVTVDVG